MEPIKRVKRIKPKPDTRDDDLSLAELRQGLLNTGSIQPGAPASLLAAFASTLSRRITKHIVIKEHPPAELWLGSLNGFTMAVRELTVAPLQEAEKVQKVVPFLLGALDYLERLEREGE